MRTLLPRLRRWLERSLWLAGSLCLGYCAIVSAEAWIFNRVHSGDWSAEPAASVAAPEAPTPGEVIGRIDLPEAGIEAVLVEGVEDGDLRHAVGHVPGTALPGEPGNCVIAGHRDTYFRGLRETREGQTIRLVSRFGAAVYRVRTRTVVEPHQTHVLAPTRGRVLTLVTCYPFTFVGNAPQRFVVVADAVEGAHAQGRE